VSECGLAFVGSSHHIGDPANGNFLDIVQLLSKYGLLLSEHVSRVKRFTKKSHVYASPLSPCAHTKLGFEVCGSFVQSAILREIRSVECFLIIVDATSYFPFPSCHYSVGGAFLQLFHTSLSCAIFFISAKVSPLLLPISSIYFQMLFFVFPFVFFPQPEPP
jgi:hypothetical protein